MKRKRRVWIVAFRGRPIKYVPAMNYGVGAVEIAKTKKDIPAIIHMIRTTEPYKSAYKKRFLVYKAKHGEKTSQLLEMFRLSIDFPANYPRKGRGIRKRWYLY